MANIRLTEAQWTALNILNGAACKSWFWEQTATSTKGKSPRTKIDHDTLALAYVDFNRPTLLKGVQVGTMSMSTLFLLYDLFLTHGLITDSARQTFADAIRKLP